MKVGGDLVDLPTRGRVFAAHRTVGMGDVASDGRLRFDALAGYLQDLGNDDTDEAGLGIEGSAWVARRTVIEVHQPAAFRERLRLQTWCGGTGRRWAERRTRVVGEGGAVIEAAALWVHVDAASGRPTPWTERFAEVYLEAAGGREVGSRLAHDRKVPDGAHSMPWSFRRSDVDVFGHVNNAAYLCVLEEAFGEGSPPAGLRVEVEWRSPSAAGESLVVSETVGADGVRLWLHSGEDVRATLVGRPLEAAPEPRQ